MGAHRNCSSGGQNEGTNENFRDFFRRFKLNLRLRDASAKGASENFRVYYTETSYDLIIFKLGGGQLSKVAPPLRAPMNNSNHAYRIFRYEQ